MSVGMVVLVAVFSALWIFGLMGQLQSDASIMRYLAFSLALIAAGVYKITRRKKK
jgi:predicted RND superfamily exporter protein